MPTVDVDGTEVYYRDQGTGQGVILLHSSSSTGGQWRQLAEQLADRYRVLVPDLHGYGRTGAWPDARGNVLAGEGRIVEALLGVIEIGPLGFVLDGGPGPLPPLRPRPEVATLSVEIGVGQAPADLGLGFIVGAVPRLFLPGE